MQSIWISNDWDPATSPQLSASGYGKVDFEGYINFNDAGAEYKFTSFPVEEYAAGRLLVLLLRLEQILKFNCWLLYKWKLIQKN
jgi:hypothetical protein